MTSSSRYSMDCSEDNVSAQSPSSSPSEPQLLSCTSSAVQFPSIRAVDRFAKDLVRFAQDRITDECAVFIRFRDNQPIAAACARSKDEGIRKMLQMSHKRADVLFNLPTTLEAAQLSFDCPKIGNWRGGHFPFCIRAPRNYPFEPPVVHALVPIFHPNVNYASRQVHFDFVSKKEWKPTFHLGNVIFALQLLFVHPQEHHVDEMQWRFYKQFGVDMTMVCLAELVGTAVSYSQSVFALVQKTLRGGVLFGIDFVDVTNVEQVTRPGRAGKRHAQTQTLIDATVATAGQQQPATTTRNDQKSDRDRRPEEPSQKKRRMLEHQLVDSHTDTDAAMIDMDQEIATAVQHDMQHDIEMAFVREEQKEQKSTEPKKAVDTSNFNSSSNNISKPTTRKHMRDDAEHLYGLEDYSAANRKRIRLFVT